jgi:hypothetical protein
MKQPPKWLRPFLITMALIALVAVAIVRSPLPIFKNEAPLPLHLLVMFSMACVPLVGVFLLRELIDKIPPAFPPAPTEPSENEDETPIKS